MPIVRPCRQPYCPGEALGQSPFCRKHRHLMFASSEPLPRGWETIRRAVLARDHGLCQICGRTAHTVDHIVPRGCGGMHELSNLRALCIWCHRRETGRVFDNRPRP